ncbi:MAG: methyltransferase family protein [Promethearchaeota archaeon]
MLNYDFIALFIGANALIYLLIHLPLDLLTLLDSQKKLKEDAKEYPPWNTKVSMVVIFLSTIYFWGFFVLWPILHYMGYDGVLFFFIFEAPILGELLQYLGLVLIGSGTIIAGLGRIGRGRGMIAWGVPKKLTTNWGFRIVRHPGYASYCYYFIGVLLTLQNILLLPLVLGSYGYYQTAKYEENILEAEFGDTYREYQKKVGMLVPFIGRRRSNIENV